MRVCAAVACLFAVACCVEVIRGGSAQQCAVERELARAALDECWPPPNPVPLSDADRRACAFVRARRHQNPQAYAHVPEPYVCAPARELSEPFVDGAELREHVAAALELEAAYMRSHAGMPRIDDNRAVHDYCWRREAARSDPDRDSAHATSQRRESTRSAAAACVESVSNALAATASFSAHSASHAACAAATRGTDVTALRTIVCAPWIGSRTAHGVRHNCVAALGEIGTRRTGAVAFERVDAS